MNGRHTTLTELECYVMGALESSRVPLLERHAAVCKSCAQALAREAKLAVFFEQIGERVGRHSVETQGGDATRSEERAGDLFVPSWTRASYGLFGLVAMAGAALLWLGRPSSTASAEGSADGMRSVLGDGAVEAKADMRDGG